MTIPTFDPAQLEKAAETLEGYAGVFEERARKADVEGKRAAAAHQRELSKDHQAKAETIRAAMAMLKVRAKRAAFTPPTLADAKAYGLTIGLPALEAEKVWDHFQSNGWKVGGRALMQDWKAAFRNAKRRYEEEHPVSRKPTPKDEDPVGWRAFMESIAQPYKPFNRSIETVRRGFETWRSQR